jgi:hypothetical protein
VATREVPDSESVSPSVHIVLYQLYIKERAVYTMPCAIEGFAFMMSTYCHWEILPVSARDG